MHLCADLEGQECGGGGVRRGQSVEKRLTCQGESGEMTKGLMIRSKTGI